MFVARDHWPAAVDAHRRRLDLAGGSEVLGQRPQRVLPVLILLAVAAERHPELVHRVAGPHQHLRPGVCDARFGERGEWEPAARHLQDAPAPTAGWSLAAGDPGALDL